ncbi:hypothetical protein DSLASN_30830 [Desulfoluna limicola]|uniref:Uncharacterized protein n=1 Tax=Desulfoluna limicola TaxID=2810562 RepID=A0ABN6F646_9BACT|nr:hypothetical protein [Desulfoluna limicola]BCS97451.1 hypothetical protein DSLASN_30830 [Desulfoluna limicola]
MNNVKGGAVVQIELNLGRHCIATEVKRLHTRRISDYFKGRGNRDIIESEITLLTRALDELDLPALRGAHRLLAGGEVAHVVLSGCGEAPLSITLEGESLDLSGYAKDG